MKPAILIFDGACPLCTKAAGWVRRNCLPGTVKTVPCQSEERAALCPEVSQEACMEAIQLVLPDGRVFAADKALPHLLRRMKGWRWLAMFFRVPGVSLVAPLAYRWIARHRHMLSIIVARKVKTPY